MTKRYVGWNRRVKKRALSRTEKRRAEREKRRAQ